MSDLIKELRELAASEEVADRAADELERIIALDSESKLKDRDETIKILEREVAQQGFYNEELRKQCDTLEFRAGDALDRAVRAEQENKELRAALKAKQESAKPDKYLSELHGLPVYLASTEAIEDFKRRVLKLISRVKVPVGNSAAGEMACEWTMKALRDVHDEIATLPLIEGKKE